MMDQDFQDFPNIFRMLLWALFSLCGLPYFPSVIYGLAIWPGSAQVEEARMASKKDDLFAQDAESRMDTASMSLDAGGSQSKKDHSVARGASPCIYWACSD